MVQRRGNPAGCQSARHAPGAATMRPDMDVAWADSRSLESLTRPLRRASGRGSSDRPWPNDRLPTAGRGCGGAAPRRGAAAALFPRQRWMTSSMIDRSMRFSPPTKGTEMASLCTGWQWASLNASATQALPISAPSLSTTAWATTLASCLALPGQSKFSRHCQASGENRQAVLAPGETPQRAAARARKCSAIARMSCWRCRNGGR